MCEYSHAMGNSNGGLKDYFEAFRNCDGLQGGFIWEWVDHGIKKYDADGKSYWCYGGDFGDKPNDYNFCTDGIVWPDRTPHPALYEFKYLAQPVAVSLYDATTGRIAVTNRRYFTTLADLDMVWEVMIDGKVCTSGSLSPGEIAPGETEEFLLSLEIPPVYPGSQIVLSVRFLYKNSLPWAERGSEAAHESFELPPVALKPLPPVEKVITGARADISSCIISTGKLACNIEAEGLKHLTLNGEDLLLRGPRLNIWRAATDNDGLKLNLARPAGQLRKWIAAGFDRAKVIPDRFTVRENIAECHALVLPEDNDADELEFTQRFSALENGAIRYEMSFIVPESFNDLPRLGVKMELPGDLKNILYCGLGPDENYSDRCSAAVPGCYETTPEKMYVPYIMPQENGNRTKVRFAAFRDGVSGRGLLIVPENVMNFSALPYSVENMWQARHTCDLNSDGTIYLNCDLRQRGLGTASCGPDVAAHEIIRNGHYRFVLLFKAINENEDAVLSALQLRNCCN